MGVVIIELIIGGALVVVCSIIGLFIGNIILFDSFALAIGSGFAAHGLLHIHPALSIVIGIVVLVALYFLQNTKVGFWIIGGLLSLFWGFVFAVLAYDISGKDMIWTYVVWGLGTLIMIGLHLHAKGKVEEI